MLGPWALGVGVEDLHAPHWRSCNNFGLAGDAARRGRRAQARDAAHHAEGARAPTAGLVAPPASPERATFALAVGVAAAAAIGGSRR